MNIARLRGTRIVTALALTFAFAATAQPSPALAVPQPGAPLTVAPGVPAHGRAWELVSMSDPSSATFWMTFSAAPDGNVVLFQTWGSLPEFTSGTDYAPITISARGESGWAVSQTLAPYADILTSSRDISVFPQPVAFGPGGETAIWISQTAPESFTAHAVLLHGSDGAWTVLAEEAKFLGASADLRRLIFASPEHLVPADATRTSGESLYERDGSSLRLLDAAGDGSPLSPCGSMMPTQFEGSGASEFPTGHPVSTDARRVYFVTKPGCTGRYRVYLAELGAGTREVSASRCTSECGVSADVGFVDASPDGASALIRTSEKLTDEDTNTHADLYRYDAPDEQLTLVSNGSGGPDLIPVLNPVETKALPQAWQSEDGSRVYFFAEEAASPGEVGIYLADAAGVHLLASAATTELVEVSTNGRYALLNTTDSLETADVDGQKDVYRYDAQTGAFLRVSKSAAAGNGLFPAAAEPFDLAVGYAPLLPGRTFRAMSEDGSRIFFVTDEGLVPQDTDGVSDVYEWANGDVGLISAGVGTTPSTFVTSTPDGSTAFFKTADTLVPSDRDANGFDYYAARIGGGFDEAGAEAEDCPCGRAEPSRQRLGGRDAPDRGRLAIAPLDAEARRRMARSGWIELLVESPGSGRLAAKARARLGGRLRAIASATVAVKEPGPVRLRMRLSRASRKRLAAGGGVRVRLGLGLSGDPGSATTVAFTLKRGR